MAELADAAALGAVGRKVVQVQVLFPAPHSRTIDKATFEGQSFGHRIPNPVWSTGNY